jgi:hypothetical protein
MQRRALYQYLFSHRISACALVPSRSFATKLKKQKRGSRQMMRNIEAARLASLHSPTKVGESSGTSKSVPTAFFALVVFPLVATGTLVVARQDLQQDFKETFPSLFNRRRD